MEHSLPPRPPLANLETVCVVAREGSFSAAAEAAGLTHGAISRRVAAVENWLGFALFERHGRGVRLTPDGQRFVGRIEQAFAIIDGAAVQWRTRRSAELVKLSVVPSFAKLWLFERLAALEGGEPGGDHPPLRIQLQIETRNVDVDAGEADLAIRYGHGVWQGVEVESFMEEALYPVASRELAAKLSGTDAISATDLLAYPLLHDSDLSGWRAWFATLGIELKPRTQDRRFEDYSLVLAAAEAGLGIALARVPFADAYLRHSGLVRVSEHTVKSPLRFYFVSTRKEKRPKTRLLIARMLEARDKPI
ncbi:LysR family transcriptional regulator [Trinickia violacea]|uniref:LysR family transcriptional regulator n=1 Tax=Trinickia violacea TaxID=2571746 RepID=A0A4P8IX08_9BURK|nr:LysR substrate-binding domain-containing protein [Trinickia violacea]QCP53908.1 LysR family transcriptional regulator [Trinickia violacea]